MAHAKRPWHLTESLSSETSDPKRSVPWRRRRTLCAPSWPTRTKGPKRPNLLTTEDYENQAPSTKRLRRIRPSKTRCGRDQKFRGQQRVGEGIRRSPTCLAATRTCSSARTVKDGRKLARGKTSECIGNTTRDLQDPGGVEGSICPRMLRLGRLVGRQQCGGFGSGQTSHEVHAGLERRETVGKRPLLLSSFLAAGRKSTGSKLPSLQRTEKGVSKFFETTAPGQQYGAPGLWKCAGSVVR